MAMIVIVSHAKTVNITLNDAGRMYEYCRNGESQKSAIEGIYRKFDDIGGDVVNVAFLAGKVLPLTYDVVDSIDGDTEINDNTILFNKMAEILRT
jgi:hypothetical protein